MTLSTEIFRVSYNGDGSQKVFDITFPFFQNAHIEALLRDTAGNETTLVEGIGYTLSGGAGGTGQLIATTAPATGATIVIRRNVPLTQETDYPEGGPFPSASHEDALDFARMVDQQQQEQLDRALKLPASDPVSAVELAKVDLRKGKLLGFDSVDGSFAYFGSEINSSTDLVTATGSTTPRTLADRFSDVFNVLDFGAKGDDATDDVAAINAAIDAAKAAGGGTIFFPAGVYRIGNAVVPDGDNLRFIGAGGRASVIKGLNANAIFGRNEPARVFTAMTADASRGDTQVTLPTGQGANVSVGDYIELRSQDDGYGDGAASNHFAAEQRKVLNISGDVVDFAGKLTFDYTTANGFEFEILDESYFVRNLVIRDLAFTSLNPTTDSIRTLRLIGYENVVLEDVEIFNAAGGIQIGSCHNMRIHNCLIDTLPHFGDSFGYGIFVGGQSSNIQISNFTAYETRHAFTTLSGQVGPDFWGGPRDIVLTNCYGANSDVTRESTQALAIWDTHEFGKNITFLNCVADQGSTGAAVCQVRTWDVSYIGCVIRGGFRGVDIRSSAKRCRVIGCVLSEVDATPNQFTLGLGGESPMAVGNMVYETNERGISLGSAARPPMAVANYVESSGSKIVDSTGDTEPALLASNVLYRDGSGDMIEGADGQTMIHGNLLANTPRNPIDFAADEAGVWSGNVYDTTDEGFVQQDRGVRVELSDTTLEPADYGVTFTNTGDGVLTTYTLPPATPGAAYGFFRDHASVAIRIDPNGTETIGAGAAGKYLELTADKTWVWVQCFVSGRWELDTRAGATAFEP